MGIFTVPKGCLMVKIDGPDSGKRGWCLLIVGRIEIHLEAAEIVRDCSIVPSRVFECFAGQPTAKFQRSTSLVQGLLHDHRVLIRIGCDRCEGKIFGCCADETRASNIDLFDCIAE